MVKKILSLTVAILLLSVTVFGSVSNTVILTQASEEPIYTWADGTSKIESIAIGDNTHLADLEAWDGTVADSLSGSGTEASPYQISNGKELAKFAAIVNGGEVSAWAVLTSDIHMGDKSLDVNWKAHQIGQSAAYTGTFDGKGYTIYNLRFQSNASPYSGMFGEVSGTIKNLKLSDIYFTDTKTAGHSLGGLCITLSGGTVENVTISGEIKTNHNSSVVNVFGSIAGVASGAATIKNCYSDLKIDFSKGVNAQSSSATSAQDYGIGGLIGTVKASSTVTVENCGFGGTLNAPNNYRVGGIVGNLRGQYGEGKIVNLKNCFNTGDVTGRGMVAGLVGFGNGGGTFTSNAYNTGTIVTREDLYAAGLAIGFGKDAKYVYNSGDVQIKASDDAADTFNASTTAAMLFVRHGTNTGGFSSQAYYALNSTYTTGEGDEAVTTLKPIYYRNSEQNIPTNNTSAYRLAADGFGSEAVLTKLNSEEGNTEAFAADIGINGGKPILGWQVNNLQLTGNAYEITAEKPMTVALSEAGYFQVEVTSIAADNVDIVLTDAQGNAIETKTAGKMGASTKITFNSGDATEVKLTTTGRAVVKKNLTASQSTGSEITQLSNNNSKVIKTTIPVDALDDGDLAALIFVHYDVDDVIRGIYYNKVTVANGKAAAVVDLSAVTIKAGDVLKAYLWDGETLAPVLETPEQLNQAV